MTGEGYLLDVQELEGRHLAGGFGQPGEQLAAEAWPFTALCESTTIYLSVCYGTFIFQ